MTMHKQSSPYDSYRFEQAVAVAIGGGTTGFVQPESRMDVIAMKLQYDF